MKLNPWPARWPIGSRPDTERQPLASGETFSAGALIVLDGSLNVTEVSGADPTPIYGVAADNAVDVIEPGYVQVYHLDTSTLFAMQGTRAPVAGDEGESYGVIQDADGRYVVDLDDAVNTRVSVQDVDLSRELYFVQFLALHIQS